MGLCTAFSVLVAVSGTLDYAIAWKFQENLPWVISELLNARFEIPEIRSRNEKQEHDMEVIQMESSAYRELMEKIDGIAAYVRKSENRKRESDTEILLDNEQVSALLQISKRTLQRLRSEKRISYFMIRGNCRYSFSEVERMVRESIVFCDPKRLDEFKQNYMMRTGRGVPNLKRL